MKTSLILVLLLLAGAVSMTAQTIPGGPKVINKGKIVNTGTVVSKIPIILEGANAQIDNLAGGDFTTAGLIVGDGTMVNNFENATLTVGLFPGGSASSVPTVELAFSSDNSKTKAGTLSFMTYNLGADNLSVLEQLKFVSPTTTLTTYADSIAALSFQKVYGSLYQWGRKSDGHQNVWSTFNSTPVPTSDVDSDGQVISGKSQYGQFIGSGSTMDWIADASTTGYHLYPGRWDGGSMESASYAQPSTVPSTGKKLDATNPCPSGFRVPTYLEWCSIVAGAKTTSSVSWSSFPLNLPYYNGVNRLVYVEEGKTTLSSLGYTSEPGIAQTTGILIYPPKSTVTTPSSDADYETTPALFLPAAGYRDGIVSGSFGGLNDGGNDGGYWSSTACSTPFSWSYILKFSKYSGSVSPAGQTDRVNGYNVRCVAD